MSIEEDGQTGSPETDTEKTKEAGSEDSEKIKDSQTESQPEEWEKKADHAESGEADATEAEADQQTTDLEQEIQTQDYDMTGITVETAADGTLTVTSDGVESAMPGLMAASTVVYHDLDGSQEVESRTWDVPINIVMKNCETTTTSGGNDSLGGLEALDVNKGHLTYIFNQPVNITVDGGSASAMSLIRSNQVSNYSKWIFNAPVTFTVMNGEFPYINGMQVLNGYNYYTEKGKNWGVEMNDTYTMTVENCKNVTAINAAGKKNRTRTWSSQNGRVDDFSCGFKKGLTLNVKNTEVSDSIIPGHVLKQDRKDGGPDDQYQYWAKGDVVVNLDNVKADVFASSQSSKLMEGKTDLDGNLTVNLTNGSTINMFFGENVPYGGPSASTRVGNVTGTSRLNMTSGATMDALTGLEELTLAGTVHISELLTLPDAGMKVYVSKDTKWKNGDILLDYKYLTDPEYVKVDESKVTSDWDNPNLELKYQDLTGESTQQWYLQKDVTVTFDSKGGSQVPAQTIRQGAQATEPTVTREHAKFKGWYTDETYTTKWDFTQPVDEDMTLYADWDVEKVTVDFEENGGLILQPVELEYGSLLPEQDSSKPGYTFLGWYTEKNLETKWDFATPVTKSMTLYAKWKLDTPEVTLQTTDGRTQIHEGDTLKLKATGSHKWADSLNWKIQWYKDGKKLKETDAVSGYADTISKVQEEEISVKEPGVYSVKVTVSDGEQTSDEVESNPVEIKVTPHDFTGDWEKDGTDHWHHCLVEGCDVTADKAEHTFGEWTVTKEATKTETGLKERSCTVCGYKVTEEIPMVKDDSGKDPEVKPDPGTDTKPDQKPGTTQTTETKKVTSAKKAAKTGDQTPIWLVTSLLTVSAGAVVLAGVKRRR